MSSCSRLSDRDSSFSIVPRNSMSRKYNWFFKVLAREFSPTRRNFNTVLSRPWLRWRWGALRTVQHHLTSTLDEYRTTSNQDERGSQAVTFFSFSFFWTVWFYSKHGLQTQRPCTNWIIDCTFLVPCMLHIGGCIFSTVVPISTPTVKAKSCNLHQISCEKRGCYRIDQHSTLRANNKTWLTDVLHV